MSDSRFPRDDPLSKVLGALSGSLIWKDCGISSGSARLPHRAHADERGWDNAPLTIPISNHRSLKASTLRTILSPSARIAMNSFGHTKINNQKRVILSCAAGGIPTPRYPVRGAVRGCDFTNTGLIGKQALLTFDGSKSTCHALNAEFPLSD